MNTLANFLPQHLQQNALPAELGSVLESIIAACVQINGKIRLGALSGVLGMAGTGNIQGEDQKKLDVIANEILIETLKQNPNVAGLASEEEDTFVSTDENGGYLVLFDPLDGSSNIDVNISVGTIFSILNKPAGRLNTESFLQKGSSQVGSGYVLYGPQTQLVFTLKHGVFVFTLNEHGEFVLTQENPQVPASTQEFAINMSNQRHWFPPMQRYIAELLEGNTGVRGKNYNMRQYGGGNPPHPNARRRIYISARQTRSRQTRQTTPDVRSQSHEPDFETGRRSIQQCTRNHARYPTYRPASARRRSNGQPRRSGIH